MLGTEKKCFLVAVFFVYLCVMISGRTTADLESEAVQRCFQKCDKQNLTEDGHYELSCGGECNKDQCHDGCKLWRNALNDSCQSACNSTRESGVSKRLHCIVGCSEALNQYLQLFKDILGTPSAPALVADSLTATSLSLVWEKPNFDKLRYRVQWKYEEPELGGNWQYLQNTTWVYNTVHVDNLQPYTKYRFHICIVRSRQSETICGLPSVLMQTSPQGKPRKGVSDLSARSLTSRSASISWRRGPNTNGPLVSYTLLITDENGHEAIKEIKASNTNETQFNVFQNLQPGSSYMISVSMRNAEGAGPTTTVNVTTPPLIASDLQSQATLIFRGVHQVLAAKKNDIFSEPNQIYSSEHVITGIGIDITQNTLYVAEATGAIFSKTIGSDSKPKLIKDKGENALTPEEISIDWLNKKIYMLNEVKNPFDEGGWGADTLLKMWQILRVNYDGQVLEMVCDGLRSKPTHIEVDPYNGYLFWVQDGLYRLDLADIAHNISKLQPCGERIVNDANLGAFTVDHAGFRVLLAHLRRNTVLAVSLDGSSVINFREKTQSPKFSPVVSLAYTDGLFYWSNGNELLAEEMHPATNIYYHNYYPLTANLSVATVLVNSNTAQPIPIAWGPPRHIRTAPAASSNMTRIRVTWFRPHPPPHAARGVWQSYTYTVQVAGGEYNRSITDLAELWCDINNLEPNTEYSITISAVSPAGAGPCSEPVVTKTLPNDNLTKSTFFIWSNETGIFETDIMGNNLTKIVEKNQINNTIILDVAIYMDTLYLVSNESKVFFYNTSSKEFRVLSNLDNVASIDVDWYGKRLYWSNPKQQLISVSSLKGESRSVIPLVTVAKQLLVDSENARLYWSSGHGVDSSELDGSHMITYYPHQLYQGNRVTGLTLDFTNGLAYWSVAGWQGAELQRAKMAHLLDGAIPKIESILIEMPPNLMSCLSIYGNRISWLAGDGTVLTAWTESGIWKHSDFGTNEDSDDYLSASPLHSVNGSVYFTSVQPYRQNDAEWIRAIPPMVNSSSITTKGDWNNFTIAWTPATGVNRGDVFYDVTMECGKNESFQRRVTTSYVQAVNAVNSPWSECQVTVRASTKWGSSQLRSRDTEAAGGDSVKLRTPAGLPNAPQRPRLFVTSESENHTITFRWDEPNTPNGLIKKYKVQCWSEKNNLAARKTKKMENRNCNDNVPPNNREVTIKGVAAGLVFTFEVQAFTDAGPGPYSEQVLTSSSIESPIPKIIVSSEDSLKIFDLDLIESVTIPKGSGAPIDFTVSIFENVVYWINLDEILVSRINGTGHTKLTSLTNSANSITNDWISRTVYWSQLVNSHNKQEHPYSHSIHSMEAGRERTSITQIPKTLVQSTRPIQHLQIVPSTRMLFWYEPSNYMGLGAIMQCSLDNPEPANFFNSTSRGTSPCNCSENPQVSNTFAIDLTESDGMRLIWADPWVKSISASDMFGCNCTLIVKANERNNFGLPPTSISVDSKHIFWINSTEKAAYYIEKNGNPRIMKVDIGTGSKILAKDPKNQPYPPFDCLKPEKTPTNINILDKNYSSVDIEIVEDKKNRGKCKGVQIKTASILYKVLYKESDDMQACEKENGLEVSTYEKRLVLNDLQAFTNYSVCVQASNYYSQLLGEPVLRSSGKLIETAKNPPSPPTNVSVIPTSPTEAEVRWHTQPGATYAVYWNTSDLASSMQATDISGQAKLRELHPGGNVTVWVRARIQGMNQAESGVNSEKVVVQMPNTPDPLRGYGNITARSISVKWSLPKNIHSGVVEYYSMRLKEWRECSRSVDNSEWLATNLEPKTKYPFRLHLKYSEDAHDYFWPPGHRFTQVTLGSVPEPPGAPTVKKATSEVLQILWTPPHDNGDPVTFYALWAHTSDSNNTNVTRDYSHLKLDNATIDFVKKNNLILLYNGTESDWHVSESQLQGDYTLYAFARNALGWSPPSLSSPYTATAPTAIDSTRSATLGWLALSLLALFAFAAIAGVVFLYKRRSRPKLAENEVSFSRATVVGHVNGLGWPQRSDPELAALRNAPRPLIPNAIYDVTLNQLPQIPRSSLTLKGFLGSGAFGEVYHGIAKEITPVGPSHVAVKTLRKGASEREKLEFLQEARLMWSFKHSNIVGLVGVCLDNDPVLIVMELMDGGDLLSYLRARRHSPSLDQRALVSLCCDVCRGAAQLAKRRFVHRDLAARNCLVKLQPRSVKIGDFGLARDVYKSDYYQKRGEGLLPVRWMAAECLRSGVFSVQSDVWSFGVLCWEVMSRGQTPYPQASNQQVLALIKAGANPGRPPDCPDLLASLLEKCWSDAPGNRPTFDHCLEVIERILGLEGLGGTTQNPRSTTPQYLTLIDDTAAAGVTNQTYLMQDDQLTCDSEEDNQSERSGSIISQNFNATISTDGYEIPRQSFRSVIYPEKHRLRRTHSLSHNNATIIPHRCIKRRSVCDTLLENSNDECVYKHYANGDVRHVHKTSF